MVRSKIESDEADRWGGEVENEIMERREKAETKMDERVREEEKYIGLAVAEGVAHPFLSI